MGRLATIKTLSGFDFSFQQSLDRDLIHTLAQLGFIARSEVVHLRGLPGTGKSHLATTLGVGAVKAGRCVYFCTWLACWPSSSEPNARAACRSTSASSAGRGS
nr:ATP-binding protein [Methylobacterium sp. V23]